MAAAQLMRAARRDNPPWTRNWRAANCLPLVAWLRDKVHAQGSRFGFQDLLRHATGKPLDPNDFTDHLRARYLN
jgi:carboxypeptidase Taq